MISRHTIASSADAAAYHAESLNPDIERTANGSGEYYAKDQAPSAWGGNGAVHAGFGAGAVVTKEDFVAALDGHLKNADGTTSSLGKMVDGEMIHRAGIDFTFAPSKSVSAMALVGDDLRVKAAMETAVSRAMDYLEKTSTTIHKGGQLEDTGNLLYAKFTHETARPVDGQIDPQLHVHVVIANATYDQSAGQWRTLSNEELLNHRTTADAIFQNELARELKAIGYEMDRHGKNGAFEIVGVSDREIDSFSGRRNQIEACYKEQFGSDYKSGTFAMQDAATQATRGHKTEFSRDELTAEWKDRAAGMDSKIDQILIDAKAPIGTPEAGAKEFVDVGLTGAKYDHAAERYAALDIVGKGIAHLAEREQVFKERDLIRASVQFGRGNTTYNDMDRVIQSAVANGDLIAQGKGSYTTSAAVAREEYIVQSLITSQGSVSAIAGDKERLYNAITQSAERQGMQLNAGQREAAAMMLGSTDKYMVINGDPGTGKTSSMKVTVDIATAAGIKVNGATTGSNAAEVLGGETGLKADTIAQIKADMEKLERSGFFGGGLSGAEAGPDIKAIVDKYELDKDTRKLWVIDEAGMVSAVDAAKIMYYADHFQKVSVVFQGDVNQQQSPAAGDPMKQLIDAGASTVRLDEVFRQKDVTGKEATRDAIADFRGTEKHDTLKVLSVSSTERKAADGSVMDKGQDWAKLENTRTGELLRVNFPKDHGITAGDTLTVHTKGGKDLSLDNKTGEAVEKSFSKNEQINVTNKDGELLQVRAGVRAAYDRLQKIENADAGALVKQVAKDYVSLSPEARKETLVMTEVNVDRRALNAAIRDELRAKTDVLKGPDVTREIAANAGLTEAQKMDAVNYRKGDVMLAVMDPRKGDGGYSRGDYIRVQSVDLKLNRVNGLNENTGGLVTIPLNRDAKNVSLFKTEEIKLSVGDQVRFTKVDNDVGVKNGRTGTVTAIDGNNITVKTATRTVEFDTAKFRHFDNAYAVTSHGGQGATLDRSWTLYNHERGAGGDRNALVNITRAREETRVYTTNTEAVRHMVGREVNKSTAMDAATFAKEFCAEQAAAKAGTTAATPGVKQTQTEQPAARVRQTVEQPGTLTKAALAAGQIKPERTTRDIDLAKRALETFGKRGAVDLAKTKGERLYDSQGRAYLQEKNGRVHSIDLAKNNRLESRNLNHLGLTKTQYTIAKAQGIPGMLGATVVLKQGGTLKSELAGALQRKLAQSTQGSLAARIATWPLTRALISQSNWQRAGMLESIAVRAQIALQNFKNQGVALKDLREVAGSAKITEQKQVNTAKTEVSAKLDTTTRWNQPTAAKTEQQTATAKPGVTAKVDQAATAKPGTTVTTKPDQAASKQAQAPGKEKPVTAKDIEAARATKTQTAKTDDGIKVKREVKHAIKM